VRKVDARNRAREALRKPSAVGPDIELAAYGGRPARHESLDELGDLSRKFKDEALCVGFDAGESKRSGSFFLADHSLVFSKSKREGVEVMGIESALKEYGWLEDYFWRALAPDTDKFTAQAELNLTSGYFIRAMPGVRAEFPLQACLYMTQEGLAQNVHNIIIAEEGAELHVITGCVTAQRVRSGLHVGVSEFYVKRNASISFTMIHSWAEEMSVRPRSAVVIEENGVFLSNYVSMKPVRTLQTYPTAYCNGENSVARFNTLLVAPPGTSHDVGARVFLRARGSRAEIVSRAITTGGGIFARGHLIGEARDVKGHLECRGLILSEKGIIHAIPELEGKLRDIDITHEAAVGRIADEEIRYLMSRGLSSDEATSAIVRGFLDVEIKGLPESLRAEIRRAVQMGGEERLM
jgi:hypothetical protein